MNQNQIQQLTLHLSQALDQNYDVVNMEAVLAVISALEGTTITKDQLEATRLAKYINQLRRRTKNEQLARRAKSLLKKWREMVGIQQTNDSQAKPIETESNLADNDAITATQAAPAAAATTTTTATRVIADLHTNFNSSETNFANLISEEPQQRPAAFINEQLNQLNQASIVIVSDSDENDSVQQKLANSTSTSLAFPAHYARPKKLKKDKKRKERTLFNNKEKKSMDFNKAPLNYPTDAEILSLSNSSMSSLFSGDALSANSQHKQRTTLPTTTTTTTTSDLSFAGRFKSVDSSSHDANNTNGLKTVCRSNEATNVYDEYINNDSSTSCSRLSPFEELEAKQSQAKSFVDPNRQQIPTTLKPHDAEYHENLLPKKRGRKKGSKGVDSVIAESRLSQQILFGAGVKKVKTTKELFNEIQGRKLSISYNRADVQPASNNLTKARAANTRPTSSCSETSLHSPHTLEAYSANISSSGIESKFSNLNEDTGNTDSDTITSEPSRDSIKRSPSLDSISNSLQTSSVRNALMKSTALNSHSDVTTQLMHLVNSLSSPLSVEETEQLYQAQIVPCTCIIVEETPDVTVAELDEPNKITLNDENVVNDNTKQCEQMANKSDSTLIKETTIVLPQKPKKSIFDLDFDDDEDPLQAIIEKSTTPAETNCSLQMPNNDSVNSPIMDTNETNNIELQVPENEELQVPEIVSIYTVHEDPNCVAKQRFTVQTNNVTNFHINALHNYYVPNINGNWNSMEFKSTMAEFLKDLDAYEVTDGADVVPNYGSLMYERIPKDLSYRKFAMHIEKKFLKTHIPPFLGVAKCLPACRRARKELKQLELIKIKAEAIQDSPSPLRVDVDVDTNENENGNGNGNLLKLATTWPEDGNDDNNSNSSSNCSLKTTQNSINAKLRSQRAHNTNTEQIEQNVIERNRKKRRKATNKLTDNDADNEVKRPRIKRMKIAINGNYVTQRQITNLSSSSDEEEATSDTENEENEHENERESFQSHDDEEEAHLENDNEYENDNYNHSNDDDEDEEYAIVQKPTLAGSKNHIVLTIKKTPSKINSPVNSISAPSPNPNPTATAIPIVAPAIETAKYINLNNNNNNMIIDQVDVVDKVATMSHACLNSNFHRCYRYRYRYRRRRLKHQSCCPKETIDIELKHLFNHNNNNNNNNYTKPAKTHRKLFFTNELNRVDICGRKERIINYSSSSSNCEDDESADELDKLQIVDSKFKIETETSAAVNKITADPYSSSSDDDDVDDETIQDFDGTKFEALNLENNSSNNSNNNNGMLPSFNSINVLNQNVKPILESLQIENCDDVNSNNNNVSLNKSHSLDSNTTINNNNNNDNNVADDKLQVMLENNEYKTGIRTVDEDNLNTDLDTDPGTCRIQKFKEWHQVLQLQSYNNEPLIVLPYVVLE